MGANSNTNAWQFFPLTLFSLHSLSGDLNEQAREIEIDFRAIEEARVKRERKLAREAVLAERRAKFVAIAAAKSEAKWQLELLRTQGETFPL